MRLDPTLTRHDLRAQLEREVAALWGAERLPALAPTLDTTAGALYELARRPLGLRDDEPDFVDEPE